MVKIFDLKAHLGENDFNKFLRLSDLNSLNSLLHGESQIIYRAYFFKSLDLIKNKDTSLYNKIMDIISYNQEFEESNEILL